MTLKQLSAPRLVSWLLALALSLTVAACSSPEERAQAHYTSGMELIAAGEFAKAGLEFRNAIKYNEKLSAAWYGLATVEERNQNWPLVADSLQRVAELDPKNADALVKLAKLQFAAIKLDEALKNVNAANILKPNDSNILALRAAILLRLNDREGAKADAEAALSFNPDNPDALAVLAADQIAEKNTVAALRFIDRGLAKDPNNLGLLMFKLKIFEDAKDDPKLEAVLRQIIAAYPEVKEMRTALLQFLVSRNRTADVEAELRAILAKDPADTNSAFDLVRVVTALRGPAEARKELEAVAAASPQVVTYQLALAQMDYSEKRSDAAIAAVEAIIAKGEPKEDVQRAQLLLADFHNRLGKKDEAAALIATVLEGDAKNADALAMRAAMRLEANDVENAVADLREALNQQPKSVPFTVLLAKAHERQGAVALAEERFAEAVKLANYAPQVTLEYISLLERRGKSDQIELTLNEAIARSPGEPQLLKLQAQLRLRKQDWIGAQATAEALKKIGDTSGTSEQIVGAALLGQKKYDQSIEVLKGAQSAAPQSSQPNYSLFLAYLRAEKIAEAEAFAQSLLTANPNNSDAHVMVGVLRQLEKKPQEAEAAFKLAIDRQPGNPLGYDNLAKHYMSQQKVDEALAVLRNAYAKVPNNFSIGLSLAGLLELKNDPEGAIKIYEEQLQRTPDALIVVNNLASLLADFRTDKASLDKARMLSQRLASVDVPQFKDTVGWISYQTGDYRTALLNLEQAVEKLPNLALARYHLALTYIALKRHNDAREQLQKAGEVLNAADNALKQKIAQAMVALPANN